MQAQWDKHDIIAEVRRRGTTLRQLALKYDLPAHACQHAVHWPYFEGEQVIAAFIDVPAPELWPERYNADGTTKHPPRIRRLDFIKGSAALHRQIGEAA